MYTVFVQRILYVLFLDNSDFIYLYIHRHYPHTEKSSRYRSLTATEGCQHCFVVVINVYSLSIVFHGSARVW